MMNQNKTTTQFPAAAPTLHTHPCSRPSRTRSQRPRRCPGWRWRPVCGGGEKGVSQNDGAGLRAAPPSPALCALCSHAPRPAPPSFSPPFARQHSALSAARNVRATKPRARVCVCARFFRQPPSPHPRALSLPPTHTLTGVSSTATLTPLASVTNSVLGGGPATADEGGRVNPSSGCVSGVAECARAPIARAAAAASAEAERRAVPVSMSVGGGGGQVGGRRGCLLFVYQSGSPSCVWFLRSLLPPALYTRKTLAHKIQPKSCHPHRLPTRLLGRDAIQLLKRRDLGRAIRPRDLGGIVADRLDGDRAQAGVEGRGGGRHRRTRPLVDRGDARVGRAHGCGGQAGGGQGGAGGRVEQDVGVGVVAEVWVWVWWVGMMWC